MMITVGCDEVGRGALAGPVVACVVAWNNKLLTNSDILLIKDSKKISKKNRQLINNILITKLDFAVAKIDAEIIDKINILEATKMAMLNAYSNFIKKYCYFPNNFLVDGNFIPFKPRDKIEQVLPIIKGDDKNYLISAASIIAKEYRDNLMLQYHHQFPQYYFANNVGYGTKRHCQAILKYGYSAIHRLSFKINK